MGHSEHRLGWMGPGRQREGELTPGQGVAAALAAPARKAMQSHWADRSPDPGVGFLRPPAFLWERGTIEPLSTQARRLRALGLAWALTPRRWAPGGRAAGK